MKRMEREIEKERKAGAKEIDEELKKQRNLQLAEMEKKLEQIKSKKETFNQKKGQVVDFGDMLNDYGKQVKNVEEQLEKEKAKQIDTLEERLQKRREQKLKEIEAHRKEKEEQFNSEIANKTDKISDSIDQVKMLLKPVVNEEKRVKSLITQAEEEGIIKSLITVPDAPQKDVTSIFQKQLDIVKEEEDQRIQKLMENLKRQGENKYKEVEQ